MAISKIKTKLIVGVLSTSLVTSLLPSYSFAQTSYEKSKVSYEQRDDCNKCEPLSEESYNKLISNFGDPINVPDTDKGFKLGMEIAKSDLEEKAIITEAGLIKNYYTSAKEAGVSEEAFNSFESTIGQLNEMVQKGEISFGSSLLDINLPRTNLSTSTSQLDLQSAATPRGGVYKFTNDQTIKLQKMILAGAAIAAIAAYFGIPAIIAACLSALAAGAGLCNWNSRGFILIYQSRAVFSCIPL
ncbi:MULTISPECIES: hypothetical protein [Bacillus]|uniref:hypothetical protein n=1 Tax=Bacillus TaxID=1386 RepID=UPI0001A0AD8D|nr:MULTISPECIES: hypothetical protein [Bacillus cereus group]EEL42617.1 hypothetical protein bcere0021_53200 [Bacillus cereus Rock3-42]KAA2394629.1 hypothetical protein F2Y18_17525 [Bacillus cereus]MDA1810993.1 hypothetical protein [Bacillus cereus]MDA2309715.1 hypothetical protein [Bacillus cereus]MDA2316457.1 hypothetical protein [Bacillus cereus]